MYNQPKDHYNGRYQDDWGEDTNFAHKERSPIFFQNTRVNSCNHVTMKNGKAMAVPFKPNYQQWPKKEHPARKNNQINVANPSKTCRDNYFAKETAYQSCFDPKYITSAGS